MRMIDEISRNPLCLQFITDQDDALCLYAVKQSGLALEFVLPEYQTEEICIAAIKQNPYAILYVAHITPAILKVFIKPSRTKQDILITITAKQL